MIRRKSSSRVSIYVRNVGKISYLWKDRGINVSKPLPRATIETKKRNQQHKTVEDNTYYYCCWPLFRMFWCREG